MVGDRGLVLIPVGELRLILAQHQLDPVIEDAVHVADVAAVLQRGPHSGLTASVWQPPHESGSRHPTRSARRGRSRRSGRRARPTVETTPPSVPGPG